MRSKTGFAILMLTTLASPLVASAADYRSFTVTLYQGDTIAGTGTFVANFYEGDYSAPAENFDATVNGVRYHVDVASGQWAPAFYWSDHQLFGFILSSTEDGDIPCIGFNLEENDSWRTCICKVSNGVISQAQSQSEPFTYTVQEGQAAIPATLDGFYPPVDSPAVATNLAKAGQTIPLKFYAETTAGPITDLATVDLSIVSTNCDSLDQGVDAIDSYSNGTSVTLENLGGGYYQYNWKTMKGETGCRLVTLSLPETYTADALVAAFKFRK